MAPATTRKMRCAYCGRRLATTRDHVVPQCLFIKPFPPNLITVPACSVCNGEKGRDDTFLRDLLSTDIAGNASPVANQLFETKVLRSRDRGSSEVAKTALALATARPLLTKGGIYITESMQAPLDPERVARIVSWIVRGLYFDSQKLRIPSSYRFEVLRYFAWEFQTLSNTLWQLNWHGPRLLGNVFGARFARATEDPFVTIWLLCFYERVVFTVFTRPAGVAQKPNKTLEPTPGGKPYRSRSSRAARRSSTPGR